MAQPVQIPVWTTGDIAAALYVSPSTVKNWAERGLLTCERLPGSNQRRVSREALVAFLGASDLHLRLVRSYEATHGHLYAQAAPTPPVGAMSSAAER